MNLKNRIAAIATVAAIAVPALAFAAKWNRDTGKTSTVTVKVKAVKGAVKFNAVAKNNAIIIEERDGATIVKLDGHLMKTGEKEGDMKDRDDHMKELIFKKNQYIEIVAKNSDIEANKGGGKLPVKVKFGDKSIDKTINDFKVDGGVAKGSFNITTEELGLGKKLKNGKVQVCKPIDLGIFKMDETACVEPELQVSAAIAVKN